MGLEIYNLKIGLNILKMEQYSSLNSFDEVSLQLPQGVFTTFRTYEGRRKVLGLRAHLNRLFLPMKELRINPSLTSEELREVLRQILVAKISVEVRVRISASLTTDPGQFFVMIETLKPVSEEIFSKGVNTVLSQTGRETPRLKSTLFIQKSAEERRKLISDNTYEVLMTKNHKILEGMTSNFYAFSGGRFITARKGILLGVTRQIVLRLIRRVGFGIEFRPVNMSELPNLQEAFITSSSRGVVPDIKIDEVTVGQGVPGFLAKQLKKEYEIYVQKKAELI